MQGWRNDRESEAQLGSISKSLFHLWEADSWSRHILVLRPLPYHALPALPHPHPPFPPLSPCCVGQSKQNPQQNTPPPKPTAPYSPMPWGCDSSGTRMQHHHMATKMARTWLCHGEPEHSLGEALSTRAGGLSFITKVQKAKAKTSVTPFPHFPLFPPQPKPESLNYDYSRL